MAYNPSKSLDTLVTSLEELETFLTTRNVDIAVRTDLGARFNAYSGNVRKLNDGTKDIIKQYMAEKRLPVVAGQHHMANLISSEVSRLDTDKVKSFLGKRLPDFQVSTIEHRLTFKARA